MNILVEGETAQEELKWRSDYDGCFDCGGSLCWKLGADRWKDLYEIIPIASEDEEDIEFLLKLSNSPYTELGVFKTLKEAKEQGLSLAMSSPV
jgi:hypothetical protein